MSLISQSVKNYGDYYSYRSMFQLTTPANDTTYSTVYAPSYVINTTDVSSSSSTITVNTSGRYRIIFKSKIIFLNIGTSAGSHFKDIRIKINGSDIASYYTYFTGATQNSYNNTFTNQLYFSNTTPFTTGSLPLTGSTAYLGSDCIFLFDTSIDLLSGDLITIPMTARQYGGDTKGIVMGDTEITIKKITY